MKGKPTTNQIRVFFLYLKDHVATATMVSEATGIPQKNVCRYKRELEKKGMLKVVSRGFCERTKHIACYLTCKPELVGNKKSYTPITGGTA